MYYVIEDGLAYTAEKKKTLEKFYSNVKFIDCSEKQYMNNEYMIQGSEIVLNPYYKEEQLTKAKAAKYTEANEGAKAYLESGEALYSVAEGQSIEATDGNIGKLTAYALGFITGQLSADDVIYWNTKEDITIALNQQQLSQALAGLGQVQAQVWNVKFPTYLAQLEACETAEEVNAIVIDYTKEPTDENTTLEDNASIQETEETDTV